MFSSKDGLIFYVVIGGKVPSSFEWHHFVDRSALFTSSFRRHRDIVSAK